MNNLLEVRKLYKSYSSGKGKLEVIRGIDFNLPPGQMLAIVGASGAGKTTLLNLIGALDRPDSGSIRFDGVELSSLPPLELAQFRNRKIGFIFQFYHLLPEFTALENTLMPCLLRGMPLPEAQQRAQKVLEKVGLADRSHHRPAELSGGEQQRVAIARALVGEPELILADEPTGNLDSVTGGKINLLIRRLHDKNKLTSIVVTHNEQVAAKCDRALHLKDGQFVEKL